jgi:hypothetical protein
MWRISGFLICLFAIPTSAQLVPRANLSDPEASALQQNYQHELSAIAADIREHRFPYHFYLTRRLDVDERRLRHKQQNSVCFASFQGQLVLTVTGNYYAAYSRNMVDKGRRAEWTFRDAMFPILAAAVEHLRGNENFDGYALEISHHVIGDVLGITMEVPENIVVVLPRRAAERLIAATELDDQQAAISQGSVLVNAQPIDFHLQRAAAR